MQLTQTEEKLMHFLWRRKKAYLKDLLSDFPEPKPAKTTVATLLKRMIEKGFVAYKEVRTKREYYALIKKNDYSSKRVNRLITTFFDGSAIRLASFCTTETNLSKSDLEELRNIIDEQLTEQKK